MDARRRGPAIGSLFDERYRIESHLGQGTMGIVLGARDERTGTSCALKILSQPDARVDAARVVREARVLMMLSSPHVVRILDVGELRGWGPYLVLEWLEGHNLAALSPLGTTWPLSPVAYCALHVTDALGQAHAAGIIHRDIKLSNLFLVRRAGQPEHYKVLDFGIAKVVPGSNVSEGATSTVLTKGSLLGSPQFMSPEQIRNPRTVDARTDFWSLGVVMFRLLTGQFPFAGASIGEVSAAVLKKPVPTLAAFGAPVPPAFQMIVDRCLARDVTQRWATAAELGASLRASLG
jgi:serine/threonine-protein kinase